MNNYIPLFYVDIIIYPCTYPDAGLASYLPWITIFGHKWGDSSIIFTTDAVTSITNSWANCLTSDRYSLLAVLSPTPFHFLHVISCPEHPPIENNHRWLILPLPTQRPCPTCHNDVTTVDLWRHTNDVYCYYDVIFVDYSCTRRLVQIYIHWWITTVNIRIQDSGYVYSI